MGRVEMLLPFCRQPNRPIMDVVKELHGDIYALLAPNSRAQLLPEAGATQERTLEAVGSMPFVM
jgi:hypothetical protein